MQRSQTIKPRRPHMILSMLLLAAAMIAFYMSYMEFYKAAYPLGFEEAVVENSALHDLPPGLVFAVIRTESGFRPHVESHYGARGLMQITEDTFEWIAWRYGKTGYVYEDLFDPIINIQFGTALLRLHLNEFNTVQNTLCAYHAGRTNALNWLANPEFAPDGENITDIPFLDTRYYVYRVLETWQTYQRLYQID